jgi:hypothetical protein
MSAFSASAARTIAKAIPQCPRCGCDDYCAVFQNGAERFTLQALRCDRYGEDILAFFLRLPPNAREIPPDSHVSRRLRRLVGGSCVAGIAVIGWLILADAGPV